ncbi:MAG TPA: subclass B1 metallo-beta-lactamase [Cytophagales bacterium]|nr:subclass B1 metallo-beta-lactamase [Cytophagales bacterium]
MKYSISTFSLFFVFLFQSSCLAQDADVFKPQEVYRSKHLIIIQIARNSFQHISFLQTNDFGNVPCNGLVVKSGNEAIVFDTPTNDSGSIELIKWISESIHCKVKAIIPTHFHNDCLGGLKEFKKALVPSFANQETINLAVLNKFEAPQNAFKDSLKLSMGNELVEVRFFGEGHTKDNVVGYFPSDRIMFGGCLIKELNANKGYLGDANVLDWSATVRKIRGFYPDVQFVVPGHGDFGGKDLLDYTINLFEQK